MPCSSTFGDEIAVSPRKRIELMELAQKPKTEPAREAAPLVITEPMSDAWHVRRRLPAERAGIGFRALGRVMANA